MKSTGRKMKCSNCGTEIPVDERFCRNCGQEVVPLAPTIVASLPNVPLPQSPVTEQFHAQSETARGWSPPTGNFPSPASDRSDKRSSMLVPLAIASIALAVVSIGVLLYFIFSRTEVNERSSRPTETPQPTASQTTSNTPATPTPTVQPTATPTPTPKPTPDNEPPAGARLGYCNDTNVFVRNAPNLNARPITKITRNQKLWVIGTSSNYSTWNGINSNWTQVQIYNSSVRGWVFSPFVSY